VLGFTPAAIIKAFDEELAAREKRNPNFSPKAPIFVALDPVRRGKATHQGLMELSQWQRDVPLALVPSSKGERVTALADRVKREFTKLIGTEEEDVTVQFRITR
jgi:hypothetical protein